MQPIVDQQRQDVDVIERKRKQKEAEAQRDQNEVSAAKNAQVHNCLRVHRPTNGGYGGLENACGFALNHTYCTTDMKSGSWSKGANCVGGNWGAGSVNPYGTDNFHTDGGATVWWFACRDPSFFRPVTPGREAVVFHRAVQNENGLLPLRYQLI